MTLDQLQRLKAWHQRHWREQPLEKHSWDLVLTFWLAGWVGLPSAWLIHLRWAALTCLALLFLPGIYVTVRGWMHRLRWLRCDWIGALRQRTCRAPRTAIA